jgi:hypothetical protein
LASNPKGQPLLAICPNVSAKGEVCGKHVDPKAVQSVICKSGGGVVEKHDDVVRCLADLI